MPSGDFTQKLSFEFDMWIELGHRRKRLTGRGNRYKGTAELNLQTSTSATQLSQQ